MANQVEFEEYDPDFKYLLNIKDNKESKNEKVRSFTNFINHLEREKKEIDRLVQYYNNKLASALPITPGQAIPEFILYTKGSILTNKVVIAYSEHGYTLDLDDLPQNNRKNLIIGMFKNIPDIPNFQNVKFISDDEFKARKLSNGARLLISQSEMQLLKPDSQYYTKIGSSKNKFVNGYLKNESVESFIKILKTLHSDYMRNNFIGFSVQEIMSGKSYNIGYDDTEKDKTYVKSRRELTSLESSDDIINPEDAEKTHNKFLFPVLSQSKGFENLFIYTSDEEYRKIRKGTFQRVKDALTPAYQSFNDFMNQQHSAKNQ